MAKLKTLKTKEEIKILREGGRKLSSILKALSGMVRDGVDTSEIDRMAHELAKREGGDPAFLNYQPDGADFPFPASICVSINNEIVHGIPRKGKVIKDGDLVSLDMGFKYKNLITDSAVTLRAGKGKKDMIARLLKVTKEALDKGIKVAKAGKPVGVIGHAIGSYVKGNGMNVAKDLAGHGVGYAVHEDPYVPNENELDAGDIMKPGLVIAIEPMVCLGEGDIKVGKDGFSYETVDGSLSAHFEHTVAITEDGPEILTL